MKKVYISAFALALISACTIWAYVYTKELSRDLGAMLDSACDLFIDEKYGMAYSEIEKMEKKFEDNLGTVSLLVHHGELNDIKDSYDMMLIYCNPECRYDFLVQAEIARNETSDFFNSQKMSHTNVL